jgi:type VI secretion system protein ImpK
MQRRPENLALVYQELLTVGERLRSNRQTVTDARSFRAQIWEAVQQATDESRQRGYTQDDVELASFAVIAFLDESILNLRSQIFADWPRQPLQLERYGHQIAGEIFFKNLQKLIQRTDSQDLADLLEIHQLCLLLGFAGRYSVGGRSELRVFLQQTAEKINRIRQPNAAISPNASLPHEAPVSLGHDPYVKPVMFGAIACFIMVLGLFGLFYYLLQSGAQSLQTAAGM